MPEVKMSDEITYHISFYENHVVKNIGIRKDGKKHGIEQEYDKNGNCICTTIWLNGKNKTLLSKL